MTAFSESYRRAVRFDLDVGRIEVGDKRPHVLVPVEALASLVSGAVEIRAFAHGLGAAAAVRAAGKLDPSRSMPPREALRAADPQLLVDRLGGEFALFGFGNLRTERWGQALLFVFDPCIFDERGDELLLGLIEGAVSMATDAPVQALIVDRSPDVARILVGNEHAIEAVRPLAESGEIFTEVIRALHGERLV